MIERPKPANSVQAVGDVNKSTMRVDMSFLKTNHGRVSALFACLLLCFSAAVSAADKTSAKIADLEGGLIVVLACGDQNAARIATQLGQSGNTLVHVIAGSDAEVRAINREVAKAGLKGIVSVEELKLAKLPYRDYLVNAVVIMDLAKGKAAGLTLAEVKRCLAPLGRLATFKGGKLADVEVIPMSPKMDVWTHRYHGPDGIPASKDKVFDLALGFKWNAGLPMNFDNPTQSANRYSSTRAMVVDDGRIFTFSSAVFENLGQSWKSKYGADQYLTCRDAFNGRFLWRKRIGDTYYGGLYIENLAPLISTGRYLYVAGEKGKMLKISTRTGETVQALPTKYIPGVIAASKGIVVAVTWDQGNKLGSVKRYDRRRMDWAINKGTVEAYDDKSGKLLWKQDLLGTSLLIAEGRVLVVSRDKKDDLELNHRRTDKKNPLNHPMNRLIGLDLVSGKILWKTEAPELGLKDQTLNLEAAGYGAVSVATSNRGRVSLVSASTGKLLKADAAKEVQGKFFRYRNHICTPTFHVADIRLSNRGGTITKGKERVNFGGARAACLTGTIPAYGAGYIAQNWCNCSPGQIPGLMAVASIGKIPTPKEMEQPAVPMTYSEYSGGADGVSGASTWTSFRGDASRSSSSPSEIPIEISEVWSTKITTESKAGTVKRDWLSYLNSRLTAAVISEDVAIIGDIDHKEVNAVRLKDGKVAWRFATGGRMDTAPTLYKGICLVGDHTGYVSALKVKTGELIYRLRVAPDEKRMLSYGKVESAWPVIGGVLVVDGKAYATAGRTQGSDGGLIVRAFAPETGKHIWARAIPQTGNGVKGGRPKRNDTLVLAGGLIRLMDHYLDPATGEFKDNPATARRAVAIAAKEKELGRKLNGGERKAIERASAGAGIAMGNEGIYSWNWTRLGYRKFLGLGYDGLQRQETVSWNKTHRAGGSARGLSLMETSGKSKTVVLPAGSQATSVVLCKNAVVQGGNIVDQGKKKGFVQAINLADGKILWEKTFDAQLSFNGLAVDHGVIIATFNDGTIVKLK
jgi:outer membrane protein assembly factor BamB